MYPFEKYTEKQTEQSSVHIFTDGACKGNPGLGGWAALLRYEHMEKKIQGAEPETTNNRMEMLAAIKALETLKRPCAIQLFTDSQYLKQGITTWIHNWKRNNWQIAVKKKIKNLDLWQRLDSLSQIHHIQWQWVKGHSGHPENTLADKMANDAIKAYRQKQMVQQ